jgi:hypothetical protein
MRTFETFWVPKIDAQADSPSAFCPASPVIAEANMCVNRAEPHKACTFILFSLSQSPSKPLPANHSKRFFENGLKLMKKRNPEKYNSLETRVILDLEALEKTAPER